MGVPLNVIDYRCFGKAVSAMQKAEYQVNSTIMNRGKAVPGGVCGFWGALVDQDGVKEILIWP